MTKIYFTRYFIETPNSVGNRRNIESGKILGLKFKLGSNEISFYDHDKGLSSDCYIEADSLNDAENKSKVFIENILNLIDLSMSSASASPQFITSYNASSNLPIREYKQILYVPIRERNIAVIDQDFFGKLFNLLDKNKDKRTEMAISWLRKGYLEQKHVDKFIAFWTGLESINELLCDLFIIPQEERKLKCKKCGEVLHPITTGIKKLFIDEIKINDKKFEDIRKARGKLLHGGPLDNIFINEIKEYNPIVKKTLIVGLGKLLGMEGKDIDKIIKQKSNLYNETIRFIIKANLVNFEPPKINEFGKQPKIDLIEENLLNRIIDSKGKLSLKLETTLKLNANFNNITFEVWGEDNTCIKSIKIDDIKKVTE
ncbi:MAG: HEPN domain-containing protein [Patescibacteria group bacterium]|nr:HEPN domain-containing protein [Patescibacteria group bacterium]MDD5164871.1 HEPN domain-containing protein [Patescibacteria group bacterium]MDD5534928.1 HEPN domain-containing protein [Patescibacteria group bacterium]